MCVFSCLLKKWRAPIPTAHSASPLGSSTQYTAWANWSNRNPYTTWPRGWAHRDRVNTQDITLPMRRSGVRAWMREMAQVENKLHPSWRRKNIPSSTA